MFDKNEIAAILQFGAEQLFKEGKKGREDQKLADMDIDEILARAEVKSEGSNQPTAGEELLNSFKVASFSVYEDEEPEEKEERKVKPDPNFWKKLIPKGLRNTQNGAWSDLPIYWTHKIFSSRYYVQKASKNRH